MEINTLLFDGGGSKGIAYIGVIKALEQVRILEKITTIAGTSIGAIIALMLVLDYSSSEILHLLYNFDIEKGFSLSMLNFFRKGVYGNDTYITKTIKTIIGLKYKDDVTFKELYQESKIHFMVNTTCLCDHQAVSFDHLQTPDTPVWLAVRMSISIPYVFPPVLYSRTNAEGHLAEPKYYVDGGMTPLPIHLFDQNKTLVFLFDGNRVEPTGRFYILKQILNTISLNHKDHSKYVIVIPSGTNAVSFPTKDQIKDSIQIGYNATLTYIKNNSKM